MGPGLRCHGARPAAAQHAHMQSASQEAAKSPILHAHKKQTFVIHPPVTSPAELNWPRATE